jgi:hypothetical protein
MSLYYTKLSFWESLCTVNKTAGRHEKIPETFKNILTGKATKTRTRKHKDVCIPRTLLWNEINFELSPCKAVLKIPIPVFPLTEHHAMKAYWGSGSTAPLIL